MGLILLDGGRRPTAPLLCPSEGITGCRTYGEPPQENVAEQRCRRLGFRVGFLCRPVDWQRPCSEQLQPLLIGLAGELERWGG